jgi:hypothetical protein
MGEEVDAVSVGALVTAVLVAAVLAAAVLVAAVLVAAVSAASISQSGSYGGHYVQFFKHHEAESKCVRDHNSVSTSVHHVEEQNISNTQSKNFTYLFTIRTAHRPAIGVARIVRSPHAITSSYHEIASGSGRISRFSISWRISRCSISRCSISCFNFTIGRFRWALRAIFQASQAGKQVGLGEHSMNTS